MSDPKNILVRMPNWIGDAVMAQPVLCDLRTRFPDAKITIMCQGSVGQLFTHDPHVTEVLAYKKPSGWIHKMRFSSLIDTLRKGEFDTGLLLTNSFSSAWWFFRGQVRNRVGFALNGRSWLLNHAVPYPENTPKQHLILTYKYLLQPFGISPSLSLPELYVTREEKENMLRSFGEHAEGAKFIGINPGAAYGSAKCWLPDRFHETAKKLLEDPKNFIILFGDNSQKTLTDEIAEGLGPRVINLAGKTTLRELMAAIACCAALLTNDSGPMHIASALNVPLVALFGSTSAIKTGPLTANSLVVQKPVECSPCFKRTCPIDFRCMKKIETDDVITAINRLLADGP